MINEYSRTELLIGSENMEKLKKASVAVFGVGGVGSHCIEALARCGIGRLILIDNDDVSLTNINRQSIAYHPFSYPVLSNYQLIINSSAVTNSYPCFSIISTICNAASTDSP